MKLVRELNMEADDMQAVLSAISSVSKRIKEVHRHTNRSLAVSTSSQVKKYASGCISAPAPCRTIGIGRLFPTRNLQGRYSIRLPTWKGCWRITIRSSNANILPSEYVIKSKIINNVIDYYTFV